MQLNFGVGGRSCFIHSSLQAKTSTQNKPERKVGKLVFWQFLVQVLKSGKNTSSMKITTPWECVCVCRGEEIKIRSPLMVDLTATWYFYSAHSNLDFWNLLFFFFFPAVMQVYEALSWSNSSVHYEARIAAFINWYILSLLHKSHIFLQRQTWRWGKKIEEGLGLTKAQKILREREVLSLWLAVIWIKVHTEVVNDLNSKTCYYNWSKIIWSMVVSYSSLFV